MHAYLLVGTNYGRVEERIETLVKATRSKVIEFNLEKIVDVRNLSSFTKLSLNSPTTILLKNIDKATHEALNAFLKNLEEPQKNLTYVLTAEKATGLLPTIVSRCQVILVGGKKADKKGIEFTERFLAMPATKKLREIEFIRKREDAQNFTKDLIYGMHKLFISGKKGHYRLSKNLRFANKTLVNLNANGNVTLQLTNLIFHLV